MVTTTRHTKKHTLQGIYKPTSVDIAKEKAEFRLLQVSPNIIRWQSGKTEKVHGAKLKKLQKEHSWMSDF